MPIFTRYNILLKYYIVSSTLTKLNILRWKTLTKEDSFLGVALL